MIQLLYVSDPFADDPPVSLSSLIESLLSIAVFLGVIFVILFVIGKVYLFLFDRDKPKPEPVAPIVYTPPVDIFYDPWTDERYYDEEVIGGLDSLNNLKDPDNI